MKKDIFMLIRNSIMGGFMIGMAGYCYCASTYKEVGMLLFCAGLFTICRYGFALYTGAVGYQKFTGEGVIKSWVNLLIILLVNYVVSWAVGYGLGDGTNERAKAITTTFEGLDLFTITARSIGCGICMFLAVDIWKKYSNVLGILLFVPTFLTCGFLHSIALPAFYGIQQVWVNNMVLYVALMNGVGAIVLKRLIYAGRPEFPAAK